MALMLFCAREYVFEQGGGEASKGAVARDLLLAVRWKIGDNDDDIWFQYREASSEFICIFMHNCTPRDLILDSPPSYVRLWHLPSACMIY